MFMVLTGRQILSNSMLIIKVRAELNLFCHEPAILSLSTAVLNWAGHISDSIDGTKMEIDYVRVYSRLRR